MEHIAIDLGARESQICIRQADGTVVLEKRHATKKLGAFLAKRPQSRVLVETCAEAFSIAIKARELGHEAVVVPATLVRALGVGSRGVKNDARDARHLSEASCRMARLPSVHVPTRQARARKTECGLREILVSSRTKMVNSVRGWLRTEGLGPLRGGGMETFVRRVRAHVAEERATIPGSVERVLSVLDTINCEIAAADVVIGELAKNDPVCQRLMTVPGVGPVTAVRFAAAIDDVGRFDSASAVYSYLGLVPGENSSGDRQRVTSITKAGESRVRWALVQAAWCVRRCRPNDAIALWAKRIEMHRGKCIAVVALARKLAGILYAMWRDETQYDPSRGAQRHTAKAA